MATTDQLITKIVTLRTNPLAIQRLMLRTLEDIRNDGSTIVDGTNPFFFLMEAAVSVGGATMQQAETVVRQLYPSLAASYDDLYRHMSDKQYLNRFCTPSRVTMMIMMNLDDVRNNAVQVYDVNNNAVPGLFKMTIPRHSEIDVGGYAFTMQYPIDIFVSRYAGQGGILQDGSIRVQYDNSRPSPIYELTTDQVNWGVGQIRGLKYLRINVPIYQMAINTQIAQMNNLVGFSKTYNISDQFYYARAFTKYNADANWTEIKTTHSAQVFDPTVLTAVLQVLNQQLRVSIPQVYFSNNLIRDSLRIDIYTSKGIINVDLSNYVPSSFSAQWNDHDILSSNLSVTKGSGMSLKTIPSDYAYFAPLATMSVGVMSQEQVVGGTNGLTFTQLRQLVISDGLDNQSNPITPTQLGNAASNLGYDIVLNLDNLTDRQYLATRAIPAPSNKSTITGAGCTIYTFQAAMSDLSLLETVADNGNRLTLLPTTLFQNVDGIQQIVPDVVRKNLMGQMFTSPNALAAAANAATYFFTPFYYVYDINNSEFNVRPYRMDSPAVTSKFFIANNVAMQINAATQSYSLALDPAGGGYLLNVQLTNDGTLNSIVNDPNTQQVIWNPVLQLEAQLSFVPAGSTNRVYFTGSLISTIDSSTGLPVNNTYVYQFKIPTNWDIDVDHNLILTPSLAAAALTTTFDLIYYAVNFKPAAATTSSIDSILAGGVPSNDGNIYMAINQEEITLNFGTHLENLWARGRSVASTQQYQTYADNIMQVYNKTILVNDPATGTVLLTYNSNTQTYDYTIAFNKGDPVLTASGVAAYKAYILNQIDAQIDILSSGNQIPSTNVSQLKTAASNYVLSADIMKNIPVQLSVSFANDNNYAAGISYPSSSTTLTTALEGAISATATVSATGLSVTQWWALQTPVLVLTADTALSGNSEITTNNVTLNAGQVVLLTAQSTPSQNGSYIYDTVYNLVSVPTSTVNIPVSGNVPLTVYNMPGAIQFGTNKALTGNSGPLTFNTLALNNGQFVYLYGQTDPAEDGWYSYSYDSSTTTYTLSATNPTNQAVVSNGQLIFLTGQAVPSQNGWYTCSISGSTYTLVSAQPTVIPTSNNIPLTDTAPLSIGNSDITDGQIVQLTNQSTSSQNGYYIYSDSYMLVVNTDSTLPVAATATNNTPLTGAIPLTIPGVALANGSVVTLNGQTVATENGNYVYQWNGSSYSLSAAPAGYQQIKYVKGSVVTDINNNPIPLQGTRSIDRQVDMTFIDGNYFFATDPATVSYRNEIVNLITQWVTDDVASLQNNLLERTELFFFPKATVGALTVYVKQGVTANIAADQSFVVTIALSNADYQNLDLQASMATTVIQTLAAAMEQNIIALSGIYNTMTTALGSEALSVDIQGFAVDLSNNTISYDVITLPDGSIHPSIGKTLVANSNLTLSVQDAVSVKFVNNG